MKRLAAVLWICSAAASTAPGQELERPRWNKKWIVSAVALVAANVLDAHSSLGRMEANPLMRDAQGRFSAGRAVAMKTAATGGMLVLQAYVLRRRPDLKLEGSCTVLNFASAGALAGAAARNLR